MYKLGDYKHCIEYLHTCLELNENKESAKKLLSRAERESKDHSSTDFPDVLAKMNMEIHGYLKQFLDITSGYTLATTILDPNNQDHDINSLISLNVKNRIINSILKPVSGFNKEWKLENELGFEYEDLNKI